MNAKQAFKAGKNAKLSGRYTIMEIMIAARQIKTDYGANVGQAYVAGAGLLKKSK